METNYYKGIIHSGGAVGADECFGNIGTELGYKVIHHSFVGHKVNGKGSTINHSDKELYEGYDLLAKANLTLKRRFPIANPYVNKLLERNYYQVLHSDFILAIAPLENEVIVRGGTGWAVEMAKLLNKDVYVFDINENRWYNWCHNVDLGGDYYADSFCYYDEKIPNIGAFAGIGTREITQKGIEAIREALNG